MGKIIYSFCKDGVRIDRPLDAIEKGGENSGRYPKGSGGNEPEKADVIEQGGLKVPNSYVARTSPLSPRTVATINQYFDAIDKHGYYDEKITAPLQQAAVRGVIRDHRSYGMGIKHAAENWLDEIYRLNRKAAKMLKQEPIATDEPVISEGAIVTLNGHKGKVISMLGGKAQVSWEDASISEVDAKDLGYAGRVEKGGPGSGPRPGGSVEDEHGFSKLTTEELKSKLKAHEADVERFGGTDFTLKYGSDLIDEIKRREGGRVEKGGAGSGRYAEEVKANNVKLHVARHLRRQGKLGRMKKGGPGSGRRPYGSGEEMPKDFGERTRQPGGMDRLLGQARMPRKEIKATARAIFNSWKAKPENKAFLASKPSGMVQGLSRGD